MAEFHRVEFALIPAIEFYVVFDGFVKIQGKEKYDKMVTYICLDYASQYNIRVVNYNKIYNFFQVLCYTCGNGFRGK